MSEGGYSISDERSRPLGVSVIGTTVLLSAAIWLAIGLGLIMTIGIALIQVRPIFESDAVLGALLFLWGFFNFEIAFGLFKMKKRAWVLAVISTLIGLSFSALGIGIFMPITAERGFLLSDPFISSTYLLREVLRGASLSIGVFQLLYLLFRHGDFRSD